MDECYSVDGEKAAKLISSLHAFANRLFHTYVVHL